MSKELRFLQITAKHQDFFNHIFNDKNFIPKYPNSTPIDSFSSSRTSRRLLEKKAPSSQCREEGGVRVCGIAVLGHFWCGVAVIFISKYGIAVFRVQAVCGKFKFYAAVVGEKIVVSR